MAEYNLLSTDPALLGEMVNPDKLLQVPGNFFVTDALNFYEEFVVTPDGTGLEDGMTYDLRKLKVPDDYLPLPTTFAPIEGNEREGAAFAVVVGSLDHMRNLCLGPIVRMHSACGFSEVGRELTAKIYRDSRWVYDHREELLPLFMPYGDEGMVIGYPSSDEYVQSFDCDCQAQRREAQRLISRLGGIYISLAGVQHEGRGYGPDLKERAYQLQEELDLNTKEAFDLLKLWPYDIRKYGHVAAFLRNLGLTKVCLLTNNPRKVEAVKDAGIDVTRFESLPEVYRVAQAYVRTKAEAFGHLINEWYGE